MLPTHAAVGYLLGAYSRLPVGFLVAGSLAPDLLDRPLYWLGLTPSPHTVGHSLLVAVPACLVLAVFFDERGLAAAVGWLAHIATDFLNVLTTQGLSATPHYVVLFSRPPESADAFTTVTVSVPVVEIAHTLHPAVLVGELVVLAWAALLVGARWPGENGKQ